MSKSKKLIVIGGGAAGFFCAVNAARMNPLLEVIIVEKTNKVLSKVKVSGGGRCNVTHACFDIEEMIQHYPRGMHFVKKTFHQFFTKDTDEWFQQRGVKLKTEPDGRMFPVSNSSQTVIDCLMKELNSFGVMLLLNREVTEINKQNEKFILRFANGEIMETGFVCIACGGYPKSVMFEWLKKTGHTIEEPVPSLFTFNIPGNTLTKLMGISVPLVKIKIKDTKSEETGPLLITHWGLSGPVVLRLSAWGARELKMRNYHFTIEINWLPAFNEQSLQKRFQEIRSEMRSNKMNSRNPFGLPQRLWEFFLEQAGIPENINWADLSTISRNKLAKILTAFQLDVNGKTTFKEEFVTAGGIRLSEVDAHTMMSKKMPGLYFAGEILDVDGVTGGFNFQHAWTSGWIAAHHIARSF